MWVHLFKNSENLSLYFGGVAFKFPPEDNFLNLILGLLGAVLYLSLRIKKNIVLVSPSSLSINIHFIFPSLRDPPLPHSPLLYT